MQRLSQHRFVRCKNPLPILFPSPSLALSCRRSRASDKERRENRKYCVRKVGPSWFSTSARWHDGGSGATHSRGDRRLSISSAVAIKHYREPTTNLWIPRAYRVAPFSVQLYPRCTLVRLSVYSGCLVNIGLLLWDSVIETTLLDCKYSGRGRWRELVSDSRCTIEDFRFVYSWGIYEVFVTVSWYIVNFVHGSSFGTWDVYGGFI